jgi:NadR type nicotinamide-nucleotide adenylyltransferase
MKKIVLTGPESTGKTHLCKKLAAHFNCPFTEEYAREYLSKINRGYSADDIVEIARGQIMEEDKFLNSQNEFLFCDTDLLVCKIWQEYKYGFCDDWLSRTFENRHYDLFLLCSADIPWENDPLRENKFERDLIFDLYKSALEKSCKNYAIISGNFNERFTLAINIIENHFM